MVWNYVFPYYSSSLGICLCFLNVMSALYLLWLLFSLYLKEMDFLWMNPEYCIPRPINNIFLLVKKRFWFFFVLEQKFSTISCKSLKNRIQQIHFIGYYSLHNSCILQCFKKPFIFVIYFLNMYYLLFTALCIAQTYPFNT